MEYVKLLTNTIKEMEKGRVKFGIYRDQKAIIFNETYLLLVPDSDFILDFEKCLKKCRQDKPIDAERLFEPEHEASDKPLKDTHFVTSINGIKYRYFVRDESANVQMYFKNDAFAYFSKRENYIVCKDNVRTTPGFIYAVSNITVLAGLVMPLYHND